MEREINVKTPQMASNTVQWTSGSNVVLGAWLIIAPFALGYSGAIAPLWNDIVFGLVVVVLAVLRLTKPIHSVWASWTNAVVGGWLVIAPWVLAGYTSTTMWNDVLVGLLIVCLAIASALAAQKAA